MAGAVKKKHTGRRWWKLRDRLDAPSRLNRIALVGLSWRFAGRRHRYRCEAAAFAIGVERKRQAAVDESNAFASQPLALAYRSKWRIFARDLSRQLIQ
jgi:hypothetical protein